MWKRLAVLALCGMPALWADACDGLPTGLKDPKFDLFPAVPQTLSFQLSVKRGGPAFRITVRPGWQRNGDYENPWRGDVEFVHAGDIEVARCQDGIRLQVLPIMASQPLDFGPTFHAEDINFDGYLDFSILREYAASYVSKSHWVYDPGSGLFVQNELTQELGENCLGAAWHLGNCWKAFSIEFDPKKHEISARYFGAGEYGLWRGRRSLPRQEQSPDRHPQRADGLRWLQDDGFGPCRRDLARYRGTSAG